MNAVGVHEKRQVFTGRSDENGNKWRAALKVTVEMGAVSRHKQDLNKARLETGGLRHEPTVRLNNLWTQFKCICDRGLGLR